MSRDMHKVVYLKPTAHITPGQINQVAVWLYNKSPKSFFNIIQARKYLIMLKETNITKYKTIISLYFEKTTYKYKPLRWKQPIEYTTGPDEEPYYDIVNGQIVKKYAPWHYARKLNHNGYASHY